LSLFLVDALLQGLHAFLKLLSEMPPLRFRLFERFRVEVAKVPSLKMKARRAMLHRQHGFLLTAKPVVCLAPLPCCVHCLLTVHRQDVPDEGNERKEASMGMLQQGELVSLPVPDVDGVSLLFDPTNEQTPPLLIRNLAALVGHWLTHRPHPIEPRAVRTALRHLHMPLQLGETYLARVMFDNMESPLARGNALRSLLLHGLEELRAGLDLPGEYSRRYLLLRRLYVACEQRIVIAHDLGLSERQYQRELNNALENLATILDNGR
jgi:hypothetical protein